MKKVHRVMILVQKRAAEDRKIAGKALLGHQTWRIEEIRSKNRISKRSSVIARFGL